jgi:hypothetical protein
MEVPWWLAKTIAWGGVLLMVFVALEMTLAIFGVDIIEGNWSSFAGLAGGYILRIFGEALEDD